MMLIYSFVWWSENDVLIYILFWSMGFILGVKLCLRRRSYESSLLQIGFIKVWGRLLFKSDYDVDSAVRMRVLPTIYELFHSLRPPEKQFKE